MTFSESIKTCLTEKYATFSGRATRSEYWWFYLFTLIITYAAMFLGMSIALPDNLALYYIIILIPTLLLFLPGLGVFVRRMHDIGKSGWWFLVGLVPIIGIIVLLIFLVTPSKDDNEYGPCPL